MTCAGKAPADPSRRRFLVAGAAVGALAVDHAIAQAPPTGDARSPSTAPVVPQNHPPVPGHIPEPGPRGYCFLTSAEAERLSAMLNRLIPADELGPGGVESGVITFIDRELGGQFGSAARWYMGGPW